MVRKGEAVKLAVACRDDKRKKERKERKKNPSK